MLEQDFGSGHVDFEDIDFLNHSDEQIAEHLGWRIGCPDILGLIQERGSSEMKMRYGEILQRYGMVLRTVKAVRPDIGRQISEHIIRNPGEPLLKNYEDSVPEWNIREIPGPETPWGYALPRLIISYTNENHSIKGNDSDRFFGALIMFDEIARVMVDEAPVLWKTYNEMNGSERAEKGIAEVTI